MKRWILALLTLITLTACGTTHREAVTNNGQKPAHRYTWEVKA